MKHALRFYDALLTLYPSRFRAEFGAEMRQTFRDLIDDNNGGASFWLALVSDEVRNIFEQHGEILMETRPFHARILAKWLVSTLSIAPLYVALYAALVKIVLWLPHPAVSGIGVPLAFAALLAVPGVVCVRALRLRLR